ncbi:DUF6599 family protein [candidate division KSB1 bacterium]
MNSIKLVIVILFAAFFTLFSCGGDGSQSDTGGAQLSQGEGQGSKELADLLPKTGAVSGWELTENPRFFFPGNLWEYINGGAESYIDYSFQEVITGDFFQESTGQAIVIDIYQMADALNAFGIYAQERNPDNHFSKIGVEGYATESSVNFWAGPFYVKITAFEKNEALQKELLKFANAIAGGVTDPGSEPVYTGVFPKKDQINNSVKYIPKDVLGQSYFENGFESRYTSGGNEFKILILESENAEAAQSKLEKYKNFISTQGKVSKDITSPGDGGFLGEDSFYGRMIALKSGNLIICMLGIPSDAYGTSAADEILNNLK